MAEIVVMNLWRERKGRTVPERRGSFAAPPTCPAAGRGEVVLFTGVRYERFDPPVNRVMESEPKRFEQN